MLLELQDFLTYIASEKGLSKNTLEAYNRDIVSFREFLLSQSTDQWIQVTQDQIVAFISHRTSHGYATASLSRLLVAIKVFFRFMKREGILNHNVALHLETPKLWQVIPEVLTMDEIERILDQPDINTLEGARDRAILELLYSSGLRVSELCQLKISDIDDNYIRVRKGKGGKERIVPVGSHALLAIDRYMTFREDSPNENLFISLRGKILSRDVVWKLVKRYAKKANIEKEISPHTFRHTCATDLLRNGADLRIIQDILGHADISSTQRYAHVHCDELQQAFQSFHPRY
jgi:integrase/recombinase XerD